ncbi:MAG: hypothetical protein KatS3mg010_1049 [Acidimicrobiia bacterium]|nr:MAG: hypothetical protein KatS3mg010_1049 [Acidimicrobiia bacterium]
MRYSISDTAEYGDLTRGPRIITTHVRRTRCADPRRDPLRAFAEEWIAEIESGRPTSRSSEKAAGAPDRAGRGASCGR